MRSAAQADPATQAVMGLAFATDEVNPPRQLPHSSCPVLSESLHEEQLATLHCRRGNAGSIPSGMG